MRTWVSGYQVYILDFIAVKDDGSGSNNWSYKLCKAPVKSSPTTNPTPSFLQAGWPSCRPNNGVRALKGYNRNWKKMSIKWYHLTARGKYSYYCSVHVPFRHNSCSWSTDQPVATKDLSDLIRCIDRQQSPNDFPRDLCSYQLTCKMDAKTAVLK